MVREYQYPGVLCVVWIPEEFYLADSFTNTKVPLNTRNNLVDLVFSNVESPIDMVKKT